MRWVLIVALALGALVYVPGAVVAGPAAQGSAQPCSAPLGDRVWGQSEPRLEYEESDVGPSGTWGRPRLCLAYFPREDVHNAALTGIGSVEQFREAKAEAIGRLRARGTDPCQITKWIYWGTPSLSGFTQDDVLGTTAVCAPRVVVGDPGAGEYLGAVQAGYARAADLVTAELGWQPERAIRVVVLTDEASAVDTYRRYRLSYMSEERAEQSARTGLSQTTWGSGSLYVDGHLTLFNLVDPNYRTATQIDEQSISQYMYFVIQALSGGNQTIQAGENRVLPSWFDRGLRRRMIYRHTANGANGGYLVEAARAVRAGPTAPLGRILTTKSSVEVEREFGQYPMNARSYAGVTYLAEQYGPDLLGQVLRESRGTSPDRVHALIQQRTGLTIDALDQAISRWLLDLRRVDGTSGDGRIAVEMLLHADGRHGEALVDETAAACAFDVADREVPNAPGLVGFSVTLAADGSFTSARPSPRVGNKVTLTGRLDESGKLTGTYQVVNEVTGCDSGPIAFQSA